MKGPRPHVASLKRAKQGKLPLKVGPCPLFPWDVLSPLDSCLVFGHIGKWRGRGLPCKLSPPLRRETSMGKGGGASMPSSVPWYPGKNCHREMPGHLGRRELCTQEFQQQPGWAAGFPTTHSLESSKDHLPDLSRIRLSVPCRGRRKGGLGKSTRNPTQVRPPLSSGDCSPSVQSMSSCPGPEGGAEHSATDL